MIAQSTENSPPASIHVNKRIDEKKAMSKTFPCEGNLKLWLEAGSETLYKSSRGWAYIRKVR